MKQRITTGLVVMAFLAGLIAALAPQASATLYTAPENKYCTFDYSSAGAYNGSTLGQAVYVKLLTGCQYVQAQLTYKGAGTSLEYSYGLQVTAINGTSTAWADATAAMVSGHRAWYETNNITSYQSW